MSATQRRALGVGASIVACAWLLLRGVPVVLRYERTVAAQVAVRTDSLARLKDDLRAIGALEDSARFIRDRLVGLAPQLLGGANAADAAAELASLLRGSVDGKHARVERLSTAPDTVRSDGIRRVHASLEIETDAAGIQQLLIRMGEGNPLLIVDGIHIVTDDAAATVPGERLRARLEVWAWWLPARGEPIRSRGRHS